MDLAFNFVSIFTYYVTRSEQLCLNLHVPLLSYRVRHTCSSFLCQVLIKFYDLCSNNCRLTNNKINVIDVGGVNSEATLMKWLNYKFVTLMFVILKLCANLMPMQNEVWFLLSPSLR